MDFKINKAFDCRQALMACLKPVPNPVFVHPSEFDTHPELEELDDAAVDKLIRKAGLSNYHVVSGLKELIKKEKITIRNLRTYLDQLTEQKIRYLEIMGSA